jgi:membrane-bound acyltransferase YfiQ involved in biofilm formation
MTLMQASVKPAAVGAPRNLLQVFLAVRGLAMCFVVAAHASIGLIAAELTLDPQGAVGPMVFGLWQIAAPVKFVILELSRCAVPLFLFLAAYHLARSPRTWQAIWNNGKRLVIPMAFWSLVGWALSWRKGADGWSAVDFLKLFVSGRAQLGYYFIVLIVQFFVLARWLVPAIEKRPKLVLGFAFLIQLIVHAYDYLYLFGMLRLVAAPEWVLRLGPFPEFLFPRFLLSFSLGIWASVNLDRFKEVTEKRLVLLGCLALVSSAAMIVETGLIFGVSHNFSGASIFAAASLAWGEWKVSTAIWGIVALFFIIAVARRWLPLKNQLEALGKNSYGILLLHGMVLELLLLVGYKIGPALHLPWYGIVGVAVRLLLGLSIPLVITKAIRKWLPRPIQMLLLGT